MIFAEMNSAQMYLAKYNLIKPFLNSFAEEHELDLAIESSILHFSDAQNDNDNEASRSIMTSGAANYIRAMSRVTSTIGVANHAESFGRIELTVDLRTEVLEKVEKIRKIIYQAELGKPIESKILSSLMRFQRSVEDMRTSVAQYGQIAIDIAEVCGEVAEKMNPVVKTLERIGHIFKRQQVEQIEAEEPPRQLPKPDDSIPF